MSGSFSPPSSSTPAIVYESETTAHQSKIVTAGGSVSVASLNALDTFIKGTKADGIWTSFADGTIPFIGNNLASALCKLVGTGSYTNNNFVEADYVERRGLEGNGTNKYLNSNVLPSTLSATSGCVTTWTTWNSASSYAQLFASNSASANGNPCRIYLRSDGNAGFLYSGAAGQEMQTYGTNGLYAINAVGGAEQGYRNGIRLFNLTVGTPSTMNGTASFFVFAQNNGGTPIAHFPGTITFCSFHNRGLTAKEHRDLFLRVRAMQMALGRDV